MKKNTIIFSFLLFTMISFSQVRRMDLIGNWYAEKELNLGEFNDTIRFYQNPKIVVNEKCEFIKWELEKRLLNLALSIYVLQKKLIVQILQKKR